MDESLYTLSLSSSERSQEDPVGLAEETVPPQRLTLRRLSTAASGYFNSSRTRTNTDSSMLADDVFGTHEITKSMSKAPIEEELEYVDPVESFLGVDMTADDEAVLDESAPIQLQDDSPQAMAPPRRRSTVQSIRKKLKFWDNDFREGRKRIVLTMLDNYVYLVLGFAIALCIYWGGYYGRTSRYKNIKFGVLVAETQQASLPPVLGELVTKFFTEIPAVQNNGDFHVWNYTRLSTVAASHGISLEQEAHRQVHRQKYTAVFFVNTNATLNMYEAILARNSSFNPATDLLQVIYETGSDYNAVNNYISSIAQLLGGSFASYIQKTPWLATFVLSMSSTQISAVLNEAPNLFTTPPGFSIVDLHPVHTQVVQAPLQIGLIYLCIFTFFQFLLCMPIHQYVGSKIKGTKFLVYRMVSSQMAYCILGLSYVALNTAFGVSFSTTFGHLGFLVIWAFCYLMMSAVGSLIEILVLTCILLKPVLIGILLLLVAVLNLAPVISPIYLCPTFYRYGYAMPVYNSYHLMQVAFFNAYKGNMGRNIGVLLAWIVVTNAGMPFAMKSVGARLAAKMAAAKAAKEAEANK